MKTLLLDQSTHDLCLDANGNIAMAAEPYAQAQDISTVCSTFMGECWYDQTRGIPYWQKILGGGVPPASWLAKQYEDAAMTVPGVVQAHVRNLTFQNGVLSGQIEALNTEGQALGVQLS